MAQIAFRCLPHHEGLPLPTQMSEQASGFDLAAALQEPVILPPSGGVALIPTGLALAIPAGYEGQVRSRSGLALRHHVTVLNSPGTIDADYRGELCVVLANGGTESFYINRGDRIAQLVIQAVPQMTWRQVEELPATQRGEGGFGHTGV